MGPELKTKRVSHNTYGASFFFLSGGDIIPLKRGAHLGHSLSSYLNPKIFPMQIAPQKRYEDVAAKNKDVISIDNA